MAIRLQGLIFSFLLVPNLLFANPLFYEGAEANTQNGVLNHKIVEEKPSKNLLLLSLKFYSDYLSPVDGDRCPSHPSCAVYSGQSIKKHGSLVGFWMTVDRLIHERSEVFIGPLLKNNKGKTYVLDSVSMNDFWMKE